MTSNNVKIREFVQTKFDRLKSYYHISDKDFEIRQLLKLLNIETEIVETVYNQKSDFFTFQVVLCENDLDLLLLLYTGNQNSPGFLCLYFNTIISVKLNLKEALSDFLLPHTNLDVDRILKAIENEINQIIDGNITNVFVHKDLNALVYAFEN